MTANGLLRAPGLEAYRIPLSGVSAGFKSDSMRIGNKVIAIESKVRSKDFGWFYKWLLTADAVVIKVDRKPPLIVMTLEEFSHFLRQNRSQIENAASKPPAKPSPQQAGPNNRQRTLRRAFLLLPTNCT